MQRKILSERTFFALFFSLIKKEKKQKKQKKKKG